LKTGTGSKRKKLGGRGQIKFYRFGGVFGFPKEQVTADRNEQAIGTNTKSEKKPVSTELTTLPRRTRSFLRCVSFTYELMDFKDDALFHEVGFSKKHKYVEWQNRVMKTSEDPRSKLL